MHGLSELTQPLELDLKRGQNDSMWKMREQARLQVESAAAGEIKYEFLDEERDTANELVPNRGLSALPPPSPDDLFFDIEGDPFAFWEGLEYLFGIWDGAEYRQFWAMDRDAEKQQFQQVMDLFFDHWKQHPDMHIYHYGVVRAEPAEDARRPPRDAAGRARPAAARWRFRRSVPGRAPGRAGRRRALLDQEPRAAVRLQARDRAARRELEHRRVREDA